MKIEVWSDIVCPWCYIGKRRLEAALDGLDEEVEIHWRSFELDPGAPKEPRADLDEALAKKYRMSLGRAREMIAQMTRTGAEEGLDLNFSIAKSGNTFDAHRLLHLAAQKGKQGALKERLLLAYMTEGVPISDREELTRIAVEEGLDADEVQGVWESEDFNEAVREDERRARELGIRGVPFFLIDEKRGISGAQTADLLRDQMLKSLADSASASQNAEGQQCDEEGCEI